MQAQELINHDQPYGFEVHPYNVVAYNKTVWDPKSMVSQAGIGIRNTWTWINIKPLGAQKDVDPELGGAAHEPQPVQHPGRPGFLGDRDRLGPADAGRPRRTAAALGGREGRASRCDHREHHAAQGHDVERRPAGHDRRCGVQPGQAPGYADKAPMYKPFVQNIASVEATGPDTLTIKLKRPDAAFLVSSLSKLNLAPKHIWQPIFDDLKDKPQTAESIQEEHPVSSGPFRIVARQPQPGDRAGGQPGPLVASEDPSLDHAHHAECRGIGRRIEERRDQLPVGLYRRSGAVEGSGEIQSRTSKCRRRWTSASSSSRITNVGRRSTISHSARRFLR